MPVTLYEVVGVTRRFGTRSALNNLDLTIEAGSVTAIVGSSGSGKSTLLKLLLGLQRPDSGHIKVAGEVLRSATLQSVRQRIGYVIQEGGLFPHLSVLGNLSLLPAQLGWNVQRIRQRAAALTQLTRLPADVLTRYPDQLSGGQRQRAALMRALMLDPPTLLLDEPLGALDPIVRHDLQTELKSIFEELGKTVIIVTHDIREAAFLAPRIVLMDAGRVLQDASFEELRTHPATEFVSRFLRAQRPLPTDAEGSV